MCWNAVNRGEALQGKQKIPTNSPKGNEILRRTSSLLGQNSAANIKFIQPGEPAVSQVDFNSDLNSDLPTGSAITTTAAHTDNLVNAIDAEELAVIQNF